MGKFWDEVRENVNKTKLEAEIRSKLPRPLSLDIVAGNKLVKGKCAKIRKSDIPGYLSFELDAKTRTDFEIADIEWQHKKERNAGKAAVGAIVGGALTCGVGLIAGAAIGGRQRDASILIITIKHNDSLIPLFVKCNGDEYEKLTGLLYQD